MQMTDAEICRSYKRAVESGTAKTKQIAILSELNACDKSVIRKILTENGFEVPQNGNRYTAKKAAQTSDCKDCAKGETCGSGKPDGVRCDASQAKGLRQLKNEEQAGVIRSDEPEVPEEDGSERKQPEARVPDFVISLAVQKLEDMTKELSELLKYTGTLKLQINELRGWLDVATEGQKNGTEESD